MAEPQIAATINLINFSETRGFHPESNHSLEQRWNEAGDALIMFPTCRAFFSFHAVSRCAMRYHDDDDNDDLSHLTSRMITAGFPFATISVLQRAET